MEHLGPHAQYSSRSYFHFTDCKQFLFCLTGAEHFGLQRDIEDDVKLRSLHVVMKPVLRWVNT